MKTDIRTGNAAKCAAFLLAVVSAGVCFAAGVYASFPQDAEEALFTTRPWGIVSGMQLGLSEKTAPVIAGVAMVLFVICAVFLCAASGRRKGFEEAQAGWGTRIPFDLTLGAALGTGVLVWLFCYEMLDHFYMPYYGEGHIEFYLVVLALSGLATAALALGVMMSFALRVKLGGWWRNTVIWRLLLLCVKLLKRLLGAVLAILRALLSAVKRFFSFIGMLLLGIPVVLKGALAVFGISLLELIAYISLRHNGGALVMAWLMVHLVTVPALMYIFIMSSKIKKAADAIAAGDLSYQADQRFMIGDFAACAQSLGSIAGGLNRAVDERMKSERMRTELITNVSHDIKTPLTSIINYSDLIEKEASSEGGADAEKLKEYSGVVGRQSARLKRLLEDLVEASKATTGNLDVALAPCDAGTLIDQAEGEYSEKLSAAGLSLVTSKPDRSVRVMADGRRMWRIFDNLINNACKYSQTGTRVYLDLKEEDKEAVITFRNTSAEPLNISAEELMERFVRGDRSRSSEGSGLGLSIARSLAELQGGRLDLSIDGDLFKAVLRFPVIEG